MFHNCIKSQFYGEICKLFNKRNEMTNNNHFVLFYFSIFQIKTLQYCDNFVGAWSPDFELLHRTRGQPTCEYCIALYLPQIHILGMVVGGGYIWLITTLTLLTNCTWALWIILFFPLIIGIKLSIVIVPFSFFCLFYVKFIL